MQAITYEEFLPALLGANAIPAYEGYDDSVDPSIANSFSTAAYRFGHSMVNENLLRLTEAGDVHPSGHIALRDGFFNPQLIIDEGIEPILRGMAFQTAQEIDTMIVDDLRNFLFPAGNGGLDLASVNIQRGRDHGLANYNEFRVAMHLDPIESFDEIISDPQTAQAMVDLFGTPDNADLWSAGLAENHVQGASVGELFHTIFVDQFTRLRDGDRFYYEHALEPAEAAQIKATRLADIIRRNTNIVFLHDNVFFVSADFNRDARVNGVDVGAFLFAFVTNADEADFNRDGEINGLDAAAFLAAYQNRQ